MRKLPNAVGAAIIAMGLVAVAAVSIASAQAPWGATQTEPPSIKPHKGQKPRPGDIYPERQPRYKVEAVSFRAINETHWPDPVGSDEIYAKFHDVARGLFVTTSTKEGVNAGETHLFAEEQACAAPIERASRRGTGWSCADGGAAAPVAFEVALFERDRRLQYCEGSFSPTTSVREGDCRSDDLIDSATIVLSPSELANWLPHPGRKFTRRIQLIQCRGNELCAGKPEYEVTYRVTRLADHIADAPVVGSPR